MRKVSVSLVVFFLVALVSFTPIVFADNQTDTLSPVLDSSGVPFTVQIQQAAFQLPSGLQSYVFGKDKGKWLLLAGRINGLHGFNGSNNFPANTQNTTVFVVDPVAQTVTSRSLTDAASGLTQAQIDLLSVTSAQSAQSKRTLYVAGGYGVDTATGLFNTKSYLSAINIPGLIHWVTNPSAGETAAKYIRQTYNPIFRVTGGTMVETDPLRMLLVFGQDFTSDGVSSDGRYSEQIRQFLILDRGRGRLRVVERKVIPLISEAIYRRTSVNVVPIIVNGKKRFEAFSGVFTPSNGVWTIPVDISWKGIPKMADPAAADTFKQAMNNFRCPTVQLYSGSDRSSYTVLMGGISFGFFSSGTFQTDAELPFINQVTTIKRDASGVFSQHLMSGEYPTIISTASNPGNTLLFGASASFIPVNGLPKYDNGVIKLDKIGTSPVIIGYIVGGIQSTLPNTSTQSDSAASPYIFTVTLTPTSVS